MARPRNFKIYVKDMPVSARAARIFKVLGTSEVRISCPKCGALNAHQKAFLTQFGFWGTKNWTVYECDDCQCKYYTESEVMPDLPASYQYPDE